MKRYEPGTPRALLGFAAVALTAVTLALAVAAPAGSDYGTREIGVVTQSDSETTTRTAAGEAATTSIDVVAVRSLRRVPMVQAHQSASRPGLQG